MEPDIAEWSSSEHALGYLAIQDQIPRRAEDEATLLEVLPKNIGRFSDLGTGDGRLLALVLEARPTARFSLSNVESARCRWSAISQCPNQSTPSPELFS